MPRASTKKPRSKAGKPPAGTPLPDGNAESGSVATAVVEERSDELQPPTTPIETRESERDEPRTGTGKDHIAASLNIAKLQAMSMTDLNNMARELSVENFGTMRKHEVIFHILQKNAERAGVLFSEGVLEVLPEGFGFLRSQSFN